MEHIEKTPADLKLLEAREYVREAYKALLVALNSDTQGSDDFRREYFCKIEESLLELSKIDNRLWKWE